jgi:hypothetical protein
MVTRLTVYNNENGHHKPFSIPDPRTRIKPGRFRGWRSTIGFLKNYIRDELAPDDPNRDGLLTKIRALEFLDRQARNEIAEFFALTVVDISQN